MTITKDIKYIGVNDHNIDLFEGQYDVPNGMAYNSYVIMDEKIAVMDTVDAGFTHEWRFWDKTIQRAMDYFGLKAPKAPAPVVAKEEKK